MKALLAKFSRNRAANSKHDADAVPEKDTPISRDVPRLPPLPHWPPQSQDAPPKPLPPVIDDPPPPPVQQIALQRPQPPRSPDNGPALTQPRPRKTVTNATPTINQQSSTESSSTPMDKKVAFLSPPPTPTPNVNATLPTARSPPPRGSTSHEPSSSRANLGTASRASGRIVSTTVNRNVISPTFSPRGATHDAVSLRSGTPYSQSANSSRILAAPSWSEAAEEDLVSNLGPRERTRQEVLWEIVASEERYVAELLKMKETFVDPLLHPFSIAPLTSPVIPDSSPLLDDLVYRQSSPVDSLENLPIAARFLSPTALEGLTANVNRIMESSDDEEGEKFGATYNSSTSGHGHNVNHPRSPYRSVANGRTTPTAANRNLPFPTRSRQSLPPPARADVKASSTASLGRQNVAGRGYLTDFTTTAADQQRRSAATPTSRVFRKLRKSNTASSSLPPPSATAIEGAVPPHLLPEALKRCLEVIEGGILNGHLALADSLRKRYEEQYPLVRSLADVFVSNSHILREYATYVLHLERALEQVDSAISTVNDPKSRPKKASEQEWLKICKFLQKLEEIAAEKAETGLAISLSKPFQRLLKYPLLFQNLLFHTDPSTYEYESTLQMVAEVEAIVRSIEDEKIQKEERDRTRDAWARIDGLDKAQALALPKPSRVLVQEKPVNPELSSPPTSPLPGVSASNTKANVKGKSSFKRFSDVLQPNPGAGNVGKKKDIWLVVFNDVVIRCQRTGITTLPLATSINSRTNSMPELQGGKAKYATTGRRGTQVKPRNMYKFIQIENWTIPAPSMGVVAKDEIGRVRDNTELPRNSDINEEDEPDSDDSDRKSKMSFSYWGADRITMQNPNAAKTKTTSGPSRGTRRTTPVGKATYGRESSANAKFGTRLITEDSPAKAAARPSSRRQVPTAVVRKTIASSEDSTISKATTTTTRPPWDGSTRATPVASSTVSTRRRVNSQSTATQQTTTPSTKVASIAPSEDSGVGMYRQLMAQNPSFDRDSSST